MLNVGDVLKFSYSKKKLSRYGDFTIAPPDIGVIICVDNSIRLGNRATQYTAHGLDYDISVTLFDGDKFDVNNIILKSFTSVGYGHYIGLLLIDNDRTKVRSIHITRRNISDGIQ